MKVLLLNVILNGKIQNSVKEMFSLLDTLNYEIVNCLDVKLQKIRASTYLGKGLLDDLQQYLTDEIDYVVFNNDLNSKQNVNLENELNRRVFDRTMIILKIFEMRASSAEAKIQVEIAGLRYNANRLRDDKANYAQISSGAGLKNKGEGETAIELERRRIKTRIDKLEKKLEEYAFVRETQRKKRAESPLKKVVLVGFTNVGKSTLMNRLLALSKSDESKIVKEENRLFATLNTASRLIKIEHGPAFILTDTVGFITNLPPVLINSFHATLEEIETADLLIHVIDGSSKESHLEKQVTTQILELMGFSEIPTLRIYTKYDLVGVKERFSVNVDDIFVNLNDEKDVNLIVDTINAYLYREYVTIQKVLPYEKSDLLYRLKNNECIVSLEEMNDGYHFEVKIKREHLSQYPELF